MLKKQLLASTVLSVLLMTQACKPDQGDPGPQGIPGVAGKTGTNGTNGPVGEKGATGNKGATGDKGATGNAGVIQSITTPWIILNKWETKSKETSFFDESQIEKIIFEAKVEVPGIKNESLGLSIINFYLRNSKTTTTAFTKINQINETDLLFGPKNEIFAGVSIGRVSAGQVSVLVNVSYPKVSEAVLIKELTDLKFELQTNIIPLGAN